MCCGIKGYHFLSHNFTCIYIVIFTLIISLHCSFICSANPTNMGGRLVPSPTLPIHAGSTGNAAHDILDVSPVNLIVIMCRLKITLTQI